jgi:hypothetical protein
VSDDIQFCVEFIQASGVAADRANNAETSQKWQEAAVLQRRIVRRRVMTNPGAIQAMALLSTAAA